MSHFSPACLTLCRRLLSHCLAATLVFAASALLVAPDVAHAQSTTDYDSDDDGLIEVANLAQLNAVRWDLDGDGSAAGGSDTTNYTAAFPNAVSGMGCPTSGTPSGCVGYELSADLDFDTNGDGRTDVAGTGCTATDGVYSGTCDDYWNAGEGWLPIGTSSSAFDAKFDGGGHVVSYLLIARTSGDTGLFGAIGADGEVSNLGLADVNVWGGANAGALAGQNAGTITASFADTGAASSHVQNGSVTTGGLVGENSGSISGSYNGAFVNSSTGQVGGLVGENSGTITESYAAASVYSDGGGNAGGLVGRLDSSGSITDSYSFSTVYGEPAGGSTLGGLVGSKSASSTVTTSYWATNISGKSTSGGGTAKTSSELQTPTSNTGIYADWATTRWDFVDANHFPLLKADWDGDGTATWGEFGDQDPEPEFADDAAIADVVMRVGATSTSPALPVVTNVHRFVSLRSGLSPSLPAGLEFTLENEISGTPTGVLAKTQFTWSYSDWDDGEATLGFYLTVLAAGDYDGDDDGLIEVGSLGQLDAVRWDLDGDGASTNSGYATAFPNADTGMGCNEDEADAADRVCEGYELSADLDFDSDGDGDVDATDHSGAYWNAGKGWTPLGSLAATFDGDGHTISNLFVSGPSAGAGLFSGIAAAGEVRNLGLIDVDVTGQAGYDVGALAGSAGGTVSFSHVSGGTIAAKGNGGAGGLMGSAGGSGSVTASHTTVAVTSAGGAGGGLVGQLSATASIDDSYATGSVTSTGSGNVGGLVGSAGGTAEIGDSYAVGAVSGTNSGGLLGSKEATATVTTSYWSTELSGQATSGGGTAKTSSELQTPTSNTGIYAGWATTRWAFVDANHFPLLKADWDGDGTATWGEFGDQDSEPEFADGAAIADLFLAQGVSYTSPSALPEAGGGNGEVVYSLASLPTGLSLNSERKLTGTPTALSVKTAIAYTATDTDDGIATLTFYLTVLAPQDYDSDDDGLIDVANLAQLDAVRWDLDGDGAGTNSGYATAFPAAETAMGCNEDEANAADQVCEGYELTADLDFDSDGDGDVDATDHGGAYWNAGAGWLPIGTSSGAFNAKFDGGGHVVSYLFSSRTSGDIGLFGAIGADAEVSNLGLADVDVGGGANAGALAGQNAGTITASLVEPSASISFVQNGSVTTGGLVGKNSGSISGSYATAWVDSSSGKVGGLVGENSGTITDSYAAGSAFSWGGGDGGGLVGRLDSSGSISDSYSLSLVVGAPVSGSTLGGLVGAKSASSTVTTSYWDTDIGFQATSPGGGTAKTTSELQTPTSNTGIYAGWATTRWDFVDANHFPLLKADWDGDGTATWGEFGDQDPEPEFADDAAVADMVLTVGSAFTSPALPQVVNHHRFHSVGARIAPSLPDGLELAYDNDSDDYSDWGWKISGTPTGALAKTQFTWNRSDSDDGVATLTFNLSVKPNAATLTGAVGDTTVSLAWAAIPGVSGWEVKQGSGSWTPIAGSDDTTNAHTVTGLTNDTAYTFRVRAFVGTGNARVDGVESNAVTATPELADRQPALAGVADKVFVQGDAVNFTLPAASGGDGHPSYVYTLTPDVSGVGLSFDASTHALSGTPSAPRAKVSFTYTATEAGDSDGTVESASRTFTIGVKPKKPENFGVTADGGWAVLTWTAIGGVDGWQLKQGSGSWKTIGRSGATTSRTAISLAGGAAYTFKVRAFVGTGDARVVGVESDAVSGTLVVDYDSDDDGLIEISDVTQLRASRLDKNGDGVTDDPSMQGLYNRAFPGAADRMGCPSVCRGYELATDDLTPRPRG